MLVFWVNLPHFPGLNTFTTIIIQVHVADLPHTPWLGHPDVLTAVTEARYHLVHLTQITHRFSTKNKGISENVNQILKASLPEPVDGTISRETAGTQRNVSHVFDLHPSMSTYADGAEKMFLA